MSSNIKINAIKCAHCGDLIISTFRHHFATHQCEKLRDKYGADGFIAADGGSAYLRRCGNREDWIEESVYEVRDDGYTA